MTDRRGKTQNGMYTVFLEYRLVLFKKASKPWIALNIILKKRKVRNIKSSDNVGSGHLPHLHTFVKARKSQA